MLPWIHVSAMNDGVNMVFININSNWGTISQRSVVTEEEIFSRMLCNVCLENVEQLDKLHCPCCRAKADAGQTE